MSEDTFIKAYHATKTELESLFPEDLTPQWQNGETSNSGDKLFDRSRYYDQ